MKKNIIYFLIIFSVFSCKKDRLKGDKEILEGKWRWVKTEVTGTACNPPELPGLITPASKGREEFVEFIKKGYFKTFINGTEQQKLKMKFEHFEGDDNSCSFSIKLDDFDGKLTGQIGNDTLKLTTFFIPFNGADDGTCNSYFSYFVRE